MITALAGGVGAARFLSGLVRVVDPTDVTVVVNVGDDLERHGLHVSPDLDTIVYHLAGVVHPEREWGRADETYVIAEELRRFGESDWFTLGDRDLATHIHRTRRLAEGAALSAVTAEITAAFGVRPRLLPATDDPVATRITTGDGRDLHFQEYWVAEGAEPAVTAVRLEGAADARPTPGVLTALRDAATVLVCPSNPVVSVGTILAVPGVRDALVGTRAPVVGVSPIVGGDVVRGMADRLLPAVGAEVSPAGVADLYADFLDGWVVDDADADGAGDITGPRVRVTDTIMDDRSVSAELARTCLRLADDLRDGS